jgi:hypothetical protein
MSALNLNIAKTATAHYVGAELEAQDLDHAGWRDAAPIRIDHYWSGERAPAGRHGEARILWSDRALCVRYVCNQTEPLVVNPAPQTQKKTIGLWDRDVCEIFLGPFEDSPERYFEFEAAPTGEWIDLAIRALPDKRETDCEFHSGMSAAARVEKDRVIIAMRIPWNGWIQKPRRDECWRANLFRCVGAGETRGYLAWQPTRTAEPAFHVPQAFGWLRFA